MNHKNFLKTISLNRIAITRTCFECFDANIGSTPLQVFIFYPKFLMLVLICSTARSNSQLNTIIFEFVNTERFLKITNTNIVFR